jgi:hypothetical protein
MHRVCMQKARNILLDVLQDWDSSSSIWFAEKEEPYHTVLQKKEKRTHGWIVEENNRLVKKTTGMRRQSTSTRSLGFLRAIRLLE